MPSMAAGRNLVAAPIGVVVPAYREADNIAALVTAVRGVLPESIIVVVDDSPDMQTADAANSTGLERVIVVHRTSKGGRGSAVLDGMRVLLNQHCEAIVEMDADFSHAPGEIPLLLGALSGGTFGMVIGSRYLPSSRIENWPLTRRVFSRSANALAHWVLAVPIHDYTNGFRAYGMPAVRVVVDTCGRIGKGFIPLSEILINLSSRGFGIGEVPTCFVNRVRGESSLNYSEISNAFFGLFKIYALKRRLERSLAESTSR